MSGHANASIGSCAYAIGAVVRADGIAALIDMGIALVALAANLNLTQIRGGAIAHILFPRAMQQRCGAEKEKPYI